MADKQVSVTLTGKDNLSPVFQKVGAAATAAGRTIDQAGQSVGNLDRNATTAAQSMSRFEQATAKAESVTSRLGISAAKVGAALGTAVTAGLLLSVRAAADAEVSQQRLQTTIEATGALFEQYAGQIAAVNNQALSLSFDDEDAQDALSALIQATGDVEQSMSQMGLAMDIARGRGIDLASASKIVIAADQERFTALKRLGIQIDENSTKESVLADLQQKYAGQAQAYADTNAGAFDRWKNAIENFAESVGAFLGPAQQLLLVFPGIAAGFTGMAGAIAKIGSMGAATNFLASLPSLLMGPVGIAGAAVAAGAAIVALANHFSTDLPTASQSAIDAMQELINKIVEAGDQSEYALMLLQLDDVMRDNKKTVDEYKDSFSDLVFIQAQLKDQGGADISADMFANLSQSQRDLIDSNHDLWVTYDEVTAAVDNWASHAADAAAVNDGLAAGMDELEQIWRMTGDAGDFAKSEAQAYTDALESGAMTPEEYEFALQQLIVGYENTGEAALASGESIDGNAASMDAATGSTKKYTEAQLELYNAVIRNSALYTEGEGGQNLASEHREAAAAIEAEAKALAELQAQQMRDALNPFKPREIEQRTRATELYTDAIDRQKQAAIDAANAAAAAANVRPMGQPAAAKVPVNNPPIDNSAAIKSATDAMTASFNAATAAATGTTKALDSGFQVVVGNTNAIAQSAQGVQDWADELIAAEGTYGKIDDLLQRGIITQEDYNAAQAAYTPIAEANKRIQDDVLEIQTRQAPLIAELTQAQADYMDTLANAPAEQQMFALAMMDSATSAQALQLATGLLSENGDVFTPMVEAAANLDPYLATILQQMGLIEQQPDGTWKVTVDTSQADSAFDNITGAVDELNNTVLMLVALLDDDPFTNTADDVKAKMNEIDGSTATPSVFLNDGASGPLGTIAGLLASLDGRSVTTYVNTVSTFSGSSISPLGYASGGTVSPYGYSRAAANGLTATLVGERGPEVLMLPGGAQVMNTEGSRSRMGGSGGFTFVNKGTIIGMADLEDKIFESFSKAWQRANQQHERSMGW